MTFISERKLEEMFNEYLDEVYGSIIVAGYTYQTSDVLKDVDPIAYNEAFRDWLDVELTDENLFEHSDGTIHDEEEE